jgi:hypothetical protein
MLYVYLYLACGIGAYFLVRLLFRKANAKSKGLTTLWFAEPPMVLFWPLSLLISLIWWLLEVQYMKEKRKRAEAKARQPWHDGLSTDELMARQRKKLEELESVQSKDAQPP